MKNTLPTFKSKSITQILAISFVGIAIFPLFIMSYSLWQSAWLNAWREVEEKHKLLAINLANPVAIYLKDHRNSAHLIAHLFMDTEVLSSPEKVEHLLVDTMHHISDFNTLLLADTTGRLISQVSKSEKSSYNENDFQDNPCFKDSINQKKSQMSGISVGLHTTARSVFFCSPVLDKQNTIQAVLIAELNIAPLKTLQKEIKFGVKGHSVIVDQHGVVVAHPNEDWVNEMKDLSAWPIVDKMRKGENGVMEFYSPFMGEQMVAGYSGNLETGWGVMIPQPRSEIESQVYSLFLSYAYWAIFALSIAILLAVILAKWITKPINLLAQAAVELTESGFKSELPDVEPRAPEEIQLLARTLKNLTNGFKNSETKYKILNRSLEQRVAKATKDLKLSNEHLHHVASVDELTGLPNRRSVQTALRKEHAYAKSINACFSVMVCDLDRFKLINDHYGHLVGDDILKIVAQQSPVNLRKEDMMGRWGGEEFLFILRGATSDMAKATGERIRETLEQTVFIDKTHSVDMSVSIGIATYPDCGTDLDTLLGNADAALYEAKRAGRNRVMVSNGKDKGVLTIAGLIQNALKHKQVRAAYQSIIDLKTGSVVAEETLARIVSNGEVLAAGRFIEAASQLQLTHSIDYELISQTLARIKKRSDRNNNILQFVNISTDLLRHKRLTDNLIAAMEECRAESASQGHPVVIEITEREFVGQTQQALTLLKPFLDKGYTLAIDDFGSGYSSFQYLADLPISYLKIEGGLVQRAAYEPKVRAVLMAIQAIAKDLNVVTLAECIENKETLDLLIEIGIDLGQGFYFGKPEIDDE